MTHVNFNEGSALLNNVVLRNGAKLGDVRIAWRCYGWARPDGSNVVLLLPGTSSTLDFCRHFVGEGRAFDPAELCLITMDPLGGGRSTRPSDGLWREFPNYGISDMVDLQVRVLTEVFALERVAVVAGPSMGAFQALDWAARYSDRMEGVILIVPSVASPAHFSVIAEGLDAVLAFGVDAAGRPNAYAERSLRAAAKTMMPWFYGSDYLGAQGASGTQELANHLADAWVRDWDPLSLARRYAASASFRGHDTDADLRPALILTSPDDVLLPPRNVSPLIARFPNAQWHQIPGQAGHFATRTETGSPADRWLMAHLAQFTKTVITGRFVQQ